MPLLTSTFSPPRTLRPAWLQTTVPTLFRGHLLKTPCTKSSIPAQKETLSLSDGDFLELSWHAPQTLNPQSKLVIVTHGLEGSEQSNYVVGLSQKLLKAGHRVLTWSMRGCGESPNLLPTWYHSGFSSDLSHIVEYASTLYPELKIDLVGFSVGGNILIKYLGEAVTRPNITGAVAISPPLDLKGSAQALARNSRWIYMRYLLKPLRARIREKAQRFPEIFNTTGLESIRTFQEFDARYTAPLHGFSSTDHYYTESSGIKYLADISVPTLIISALDDQFLSPQCFPETLAKNSTAVHLETPKHGGHVGFIDSLNLRETWLEGRILEFLTHYK